MNSKTPRKELRVIGIDDSPFDKHKKGNCRVIGTIFRGGKVLDGLVSTNIKIDGQNSTKKILEMINNSKFKTHLQCIFLDGIAVGGFNVIDIQKLSSQTGIPVIAIIRNYPDYKKIFSALKKIGQEKKIKTIERFPKPVRINRIFCQLINIEKEKAKKILDITCTRSNIPEALRTAHIIAGGITTGESRGRA